MIRTMLWVIVWIMTLGMLSIDAKYKDGLHIKLKGWGRNSHE